MSFNKERFFEYIKSEKNSKEFTIKLYRLYKIYNLINQVLEKKGKEVLEKLEDSIYTVDSVVMEDKERISLEFSNISDKLKNIENEKLINDITPELSKLKNEFEELDLSDESVLFYFKKNISILQATLGIKNTFFLAAYEAFLELYRNINIKVLPNNNYKLLRDSKYKYIVEKNCNQELYEKDPSERNKR